ncbi:MAG: hypothetical protein IJM50_03395 [Lachnospiraceae bacterium]|nr:hypothetical protein [Lachnospiraceae bacterium]
MHKDKRTGFFSSRNRIIFYLIEHLFGLVGLALAHTASDAASVIITALMAVLYYRKIRKAEE